MVVRQDLQRLLVLALAHEESRRLRHEPDEHDLEDRRGSLDDTGDTPRPVVGDLERAVSGPCSTEVE